MAGALPSAAAERPVGLLSWPGGRVVQGQQGVAGAVDDRVTETLGPQSQATGINEYRLSFNHGP
jgi:hypothetical protein